MIIRPRGRPINGKHPRTAMAALGLLHVVCIILPKNWESASNQARNLAWTVV